jgi:hypothetical protein
MSTYLILKAQYELEGAEAAEAEKYAPYEYTAAKLYLDKAREEQGYADFGASIEYAWKAEELAVQGRERAFKIQDRETAPLQAPTFIPGEIDSAEPTAPVIIQEQPTSPTINIEIQPPPTEPAPPSAPEIEEIEIVPPSSQTKPKAPPTAPPQFNIEIVPPSPEGESESEPPQTN